MTKRSEQETIIGKAADEDSWNVWTTEPPMIRKLQRLADQLQLTVIGSGTKGGPWLEVQIPADRIRVLVPRRTRRPLDGEQKDAAREHMKRLGATRSRRSAGTPDPERRNWLHHEQESTVD